MNLHNLEKIKKVRLEELDPNKLIDIKDIIINQNKTKNERIMDYLESNPNPYVVKCNDIIIQMSFSSDHIFFDDCVEHYLINYLNDRL